MHYEKFQDINFRGDSLAVIMKANSIVHEYAEAGYAITLRQLYYQFVARGLLPNTERSYKNLGNKVSQGRLAGLLPWDVIEDRTRGVDVPSSWDSPADIVDTAANAYKRDPWADQPRRVEVWIEKEALAGIAAQICDELRVPLLSCRGYTSQSEMWRAGARMFRTGSRERKRTLVLHLGDHDPSGIDMTRDNRDRLGMFSGSALGGLVDLRRIALNMDQIEQYDPPPNPTKMSDSRTGNYEDWFGDECWELDALDPPTLTALIREHVEAEIDWDAWGETMAREDDDRAKIRDAAERLRDESEE